MNIVIFSCAFFVVFHFVSGQEKGVPDVIIESIVPLSPKKLLVKWQPSFIPTSGSLIYITRYKVKGGDFERITSKKTEITLKNLTPNTVYIIMVRSVKDKERGDWSAIRQITTKPLFSAGSVQGNIIVNEVTEKSVLLEWTTNINVSHIDSITGFQVILKSKDGQMKKKSDGYSLKFDGLKPEYTYAVNLYVLQHNGKRTRIGRTKFQTLEEQRSAPRKLRIKFITHKTIAVKWKHIKSSTANESLTGYILQYRHRRGSDFSQTCDVFIDRDSKSYKIHGLLPDVKYAIRVAGEFGNITGSFSEWLRIKTTSYLYADSDVTVFHISAYSVLLKWPKVSENITRVSLDIVSDSLDPDYTGHMMPNVKEMHLQLYTNAEHEVLKDLLPVTKYKATLTFETLGQCTFYKYVEFETTLADCEQSCNKSDDVTLFDYESHLRIIPLFDTEWLVTWQPLLRIQDANDYVFLLRLLGEPFMYELSSYLIPGNQHYHVFEEFATAHAYTLNIQIFKSGGGLPIISQYLLILPMKEVAQDRLESETQDFGNYWQPTSMDILIEQNIDNITIVGNNTDFVSSKSLQGTSLVLISKNDVIDEWTNQTIDVKNRETQPDVDVIHDVNVVEGTALDVTCHARGDPYPSITWLNTSSGQDLENEDSNMNRTLSVVDTKYVGSSILVDGRAYMGVRSFLSIKNISLWDNNEYACAAESSAGSNITAFRINVIPKPPEPVTDLFVYPTTPFEIEIGWKYPDEKPEDHPGHVMGYQVELLDEFNFVLDALNMTDTSLVVDELSSDTLYNIKVSAFHLYSIGEPEAVMVKTPIIPTLEPPEQVTMTTLNATTIQVQWVPPRVVKERQVLLRSYVFRHKEVGSHIEEEMNLQKQFNNISIIDLKPECKYEVRVIALSEDGQVASSVWVQGNTSRESYMNETVPPPPPNGVFLKLLSGNIVVHWLPPTPDENILVRGYIIDVFHNNTKRQTMEVAYKESNVKIYEVEMGVLYRISVRAKNRAGTSIDRSEELKIPIEYVTQFPVQNFRGRALSSTKLELTWDAPEKGAFSAFVLSYTLAGDKKPDLPGGGNLPASVLNYIVRSLKPNTGYVFNITPYLKDIRGVTVNTTVVTYTDKPSSPPYNVSLTVVNSTSILIKCSPPLEGKNGPIVEYKIAYRDKYDRKYTLTKADDNEELNYYLAGLEPATVYEIRIRAFTVNGSGPWSPWLQEKTAKREPVQPKVPRNLTASATDSSITLYWIPPEQDIRELTGYVLGFGRFIPEVFRESVTRDKTSFTFNNLESETAYIVSIRSFNDFGESSAIFELVTTL